jgi:lipopolysaccharide transport system permease protein
MSKLERKISRKPILSTLLQNWELIFIFALRDFKVKYNHSLLGYIWALLPQLATVGLFTVLAQKRVFNMGTTDLPYVLHALWSVSLWQLFSSAILNSQNSLVNSGSLILKDSFEKVTLVISAIFPSLLDFFIRLLPIIAACIWYNYIPTSHIMLIPILIFFVILMAVGLGLYLSVTNLVFSDLSNITSILLTFGLFLAPILYPPPTNGLFSMINYLNPFSPLLIATQDLMAGRIIDNLPSVIFSSLLSIIIFISGWRFFHLALPKAVERS